MVESSLRKCSYKALVYACVPQGVNKAGQPYKLLKLVLEDQSYAGTVTCAVWDEAAQAYLKKLTLPVVIGLSKCVRDTAFSRRSDTTNLELTQL